VTRNLPRSLRLLTGPRNHFGPQYQAQAGNLPAPAHHPVDMLAWLVVFHNVPVTPPRFMP
jgi:hypothetical protein